jgi:hypothetical protein
MLPITAEANRFYFTLLVVQMQNTTLENILILPTHASFN